MGTLIYDGRSAELEVEDRTLAHLEFVIMSKLRRNERFQLTLHHGVERGSGRSSLWISPASSLHFRYAGGRMPTLNRAWLETLMDSANSPQGLRHIPEPAGSPA